mgnify:CR=1 FL=1
MSKPIAVGLSVATAETGGAKEFLGCSVILVELPMEPPGKNTEMGP